MIEYVKCENKLPENKSNVIVLLGNGDKVNARYVNGKFIGMYEMEGITLRDVIRWKPALLAKGHSAEFGEMLVQLTLKDGLEIFRTEFAGYNDKTQERLFNECKVIDTQIRKEL